MVQRYGIFKFHISVMIILLSFSDNANETKSHQLFYMYVNVFVKKYMQLNIAAYCYLLYWCI